MVRKVLILVGVVLAMSACGRASKVPARIPQAADSPYGRKAGAWYHTEARIEPCTHPGYEGHPENCPYHKHP